MSKNRPSRKKRRVYGQADKERRDKRIIKAFRVMSPEDSLEIAPVVEDLDWDTDSLEYTKVPKVHKAFILDPRHVTQHFREGFETGFNFARALDAARNQGQGCEDWIEAKIGDIYVSRRRHVLARIESREMKIETQAMKRTLGDEGVRGLRGSQARRAGSLSIYLAQLQPETLPDRDAERSYIDALETALVIHGISKVNFGPVQVVDRN
jgi:hypothetical protein